MVSGRNILTKQDKKIIFIRQISHNADRDNRMKKKINTRCSCQTFQESIEIGGSDVGWHRNTVSRSYGSGVVQISVEILITKFRYLHLFDCFSAAEGQLLPVTQIVGTSGLWEGAS